MATIPPKWLPHKGMTLEEIPAVDFDTVQGLVRTDLLIVKQAGASRDPSELEANWFSYPPDYLLPDSAYVEATADDVLWKWNDLQAKGNQKYDGVFRTTVPTENGSLAMIHFWDLSVNDTCDQSHNAEVMFPISLTENEALWLMTAIGLNPRKEGCQSGKEIDDFYHYRFNIDLMQVGTYLAKLKVARDRDPNTLTDDRYEEIYKALGDLESSHFWEGTGIFIAGGVGAAVVTGAFMAGGSILLKRIASRVPLVLALLLALEIQKKDLHKNQS